MAVVAVDQATKQMAINRLIQRPVGGPGPLRFSLVANRGALLGAPVPVGVIVIAVGLLIIVGAAALTSPTSRASALGWGAIRGGALGNLVDRYRHRTAFPDHAVVDWIGAVNLPTFNLADLAIVGGAFLVAVASARLGPASDEILGKAR